MKNQKIYTYFERKKTLIGEPSNIAARLGYNASSLFEF